MIPVEPACFVGSHPVILRQEESTSCPMVAELDDHGLVLTEWELTPLDIQRLLSGGHLKVWMRITDESEFPPLDLEVGDPSMTVEES